MIGAHLIRGSPFTGHPGVFAGKSGEQPRGRRIFVLEALEIVMSTDMQAPQRNNGRILAGIAVILAGLSMLADRTGFGRLHLSGRYWPLILIALGVLKLSDRSRPDGSRRSPRTGLWLVYIGVWGLVSEFHLFGFDFRDSWPLLVIGAGALIVWRAFERPADRRGSVRES